MKGRIQSFIAAIIFITPLASFTQNARSLECHFNNLTTGKVDEARFSPSDKLEMWWENKNDSAKTEKDKEVYYPVYSDIILRFKSGAFKIVDVCHLGHTNRENEKTILFCIADFKPFSKQKNNFKRIVNNEFPREKRIYMELQDLKFIPNQDKTKTFNVGLFASMFFLVFK